MKGADRVANGLIRPWFATAEQQTRNVVLGSIDFGPHANGFSGALPWPPPLREVKPCSASSRTLALSVPVVGLVYLFPLGWFLGLHLVFGAFFVLLIQWLALGAPG